MNKRVLIGLSGGVDSSVGAALLVESGFEVIGVTLKLYDFGELGFDPPDGGCCTLDLIEDARAVCARLNIPHYVVDLREDFRRDVIDDFIESYGRGRTPNPCINCNRYIKWGEMLGIADKLDCHYLATGHYARIARDGGGVRLLKAVDGERDQSYALWGIPLPALQRTLFPLGDISKHRTREIAAELGLRNALRPDSQEICFVPKNDYTYVLRRRMGEGSPALRTGPIYDNEGNEIGRHKGIAGYTIGQRRGLGVSRGTPLYVTKISVDDGSIVVGSDADLRAKRFTANDLNLLREGADIPRRIEAKIRYRHRAAPALLSLEQGTAEIEFETPQRAITPGQSVVFYDGDTVLGGGVIDKVLG